MSVRRKQNGKWMIDIDFEYPDGRRGRIQKVSPVQTRRGAEQYERELRQALLDGSFGRKAVQAPAVAAFAKEFLETYCKTHNTPSEVHARRSIVRVRLEPHLGHLRLDQVGVREIEAFKAKLVGEELKPTTINNALRLLSKMLHHACDLGILQSTPKIKLMKVTDVPYDFLTFEEADRLVGAAKAESAQSYAAILFALDTGARRGEQLALEWGDLDLKAGLVRFARSDWEGHVTGTKSGKVRTVPLTGRLLAALKAQRHLKGPRVFCQAGGEPWTAQVLKRLLPRLLKKAGLRQTHWHALRHTFASHLVMRGATMKSVQELMGHASITMTMKYSHLQPGALRDSIRLLEAPLPFGLRPPDGPAERFDHDLA